MTAAGLPALREQLCAYLAAKLPESELLSGVPCAKRPLPAGKTAVAVDISGVKTLNVQLDGYIGEPASPSFAGGVGRALELGLRLDIYHPDDLSKCQETFAELAGALLLDREAPLELLSLSSAPPVYSRGEGAFHIAAAAALRAFISFAEDTTEITDFTVRRDSI